MDGVYRVAVFKVDVVIMINFKLAYCIVVIEDTDETFLKKFPKSIF
jgi:hypothetical protein